MKLNLDGSVVWVVGAHRQQQQGQGPWCQLSCQLIHEGSSLAFPQETSRYGFEMTPWKVAATL